jgi:hypothetical protein
MKKPDQILHVIDAAQFEWLREDTDYFRLPYMIDHITYTDWYIVEKFDVVHDEYTQDFSAVYGVISVPFKFGPWRI